ncbi:MAG TPA: glycosyltransferase family 1 protein [Caulobacteraceae bacterium]|nr:glycosyltransferase family 1 protein [Caulobacteraceae bacterium]
MSETDPSPPLARRILLVTDAWAPQVNGVVRTLERLVAELRAMGCEVEVIAPSDGYRTIPLVTYSEIRLALGARSDIEARFTRFAPDAVHIAVEGPLGWEARAVCLKHGFPFSTCYHTQWPEYVSARFPFVPLAAGYRVMRAFHRPSGRVMVSLDSMRDRLELRGFRNLGHWRRAVDTDLFHPARRGADGGVYAGLPRPIFVNVGRVAVEKNLEAFLELDLPGTKVIVGDGPHRGALQARYPDVVFTGYKSGDDLARHFADADVFVFPSLTETWGGVLVEALAAGTPVAGFPAPGPNDFDHAVVAVDADLRAACLAALNMDRAQARAYAERFSWRACAEDFQRNLSPLPPPQRRRLFGRLRALRKKRWKIAA